MCSVGFYLRALDSVVSCNSWGFSLVAGLQVRASFLGAAAGTRATLWLKGSAAVGGKIQATYLVLPNVKKYSLATNQLYVRLGAGFVVSLGLTMFPWLLR